MGSVVGWRLVLAVGLGWGCLLEGEGEKGWDGVEKLEDVTMN